MTDYIYKAVDEFPEDFTTPVVSPAADHMFRVNNSRKRLSKKQAILLHGLVEKLLSVSNHASPDIHPDILFITTRIQNLDEDY